MNLLTKLWRGEYSLAKTYWVFNVLVGIAVNIPISIFGILPYKTQSDNVNLFFGFVCLTGSYGLIALVGLWRSSNNYKGSQIWAFLSKVVVCLGGFMVLSSLGYIYKLSFGYAVFYFLAVVLVSVYVDNLSNTKKSNTNTSSNNTAPIKTQAVETQHTDAIWEHISKELNSSERKEGLWTRCFVEANGDENQAKLQYLKVRFDEESKGLKTQEATPKAPQLTSKINSQQDIFTIECEPKDENLNYSQYSASTLLSMGMFERKNYKVKTLFYLHNGNVACISGQLMKVFDTESFIKKAIDKGTLSDKYPSGLIVSFDKDSLK